MAEKKDHKTEWRHVGWKIKSIFLIRFLILFIFFLSAGLAFSCSFKARRISFELDELFAIEKTFLNLWDQAKTKENVAVVENFRKVLNLSSLSINEGLFPLTALLNKSTMLVDRHSFLFLLCEMHSIKRLRAEFLTGQKYKGICVRRRVQGESQDSRIRNFHFSWL